MFEDRIAAPTERTERPGPQPVRPAQPQALSPAAVLALQRSAGNRAVAAMLAREPVPLEESPVEDPLGECVEGDLPVADVGADLQERLTTYADAVPAMERSSAATRSIEEDWAGKRNVWATLIEVLNAQIPPDPARWEGITTSWDAVAEQLTAALAVPIADDTINDLGLQGQQALELFDDTFQRAHDARERFAAYMEAFTDTAETTVFVTGLTRDIAFCAAVGAAVVLAAPVVAGAAAAVGTGTLGLAAGSAGLAAFEAGVTVASMGVLGASIEGGLNALGTLGVQAGDAVTDLLRGSSDAADNFDLAELRDASWEGMKRGFVDGVLAVVGLEAERILASYASAAVRSLLGTGGCNLYALVLRRVLTRATSGGLSGGAVGALDAGYRAASDGQELGGIVEAMAVGFGLGAGMGAGMGAAGGALEARGADQLRQRVAAGLSEQLAKARPRMEEGDELVQELLEQLRANPGVGNNKKLLELLPKAWDALRDPDTLAAALSEVWLEDHLLSLVAPPAAATRYGDAALQLASRRGAPVRVLEPGAPYDAQRFFDEVVTSGDRFLDNNILASQPDHGATTHLIQDLAVDRALEGTGVRAEELRALLADAVGDNGRQIGDELWFNIFDADTGFLAINQPEVMWAIMRAELTSLP